jgi:hypothetical protein
MSIRFWAAALVVSTTVVASLATSGCGTRVGTGGGSDSGAQAPLAVITPIGYKATSAAGASPVAITVRSGADVVLSAKDSDGLAVALKTFSFAQTGGPALPALPSAGALLYRTSNTVSFRAPDVTSATKLTFRLTVTNALDTSSTTDAEVTVLPSSDSNQFLIPQVVNSPPPQKFQVAVATAEGLTGLTSDTPVCVKVSRQVQYRGRNQGAQDTPLVADLPQLPELQADAAWLASVDTVPATNPDGSPNLDNAVHSHTNLHFAFPLPAFNDEDLFALFNQPAPGESPSDSTARQAKQLLPNDVDTAHLLLSVSATPGSCDGKTSAPALQAKTLVLAVVDDAGTEHVVLSSAATAPNSAATVNQDASGAALTSDALLTTVRTASDAPVETLASTTAYYKVIDPNSTKLTLDQWLDANCFDHTAADYGTGAAGANGAHAVYTNNFDLGFGRDMYFIKCTADHTDASGNVAHAGDMASVVINYPSLEQTALKQNPIIAVAMEYSADPGSTGARVTKFYAFAPNQRDGGFTRVSSANFDKRGQKYLPGSCLPCHGGKVADSTFATGSNVNASFMPWDLDALLYSDTDPAFKGFLTDGTPFTRKAQEPNLQKLNALVFQTWQVPDPIPASGTGTCLAVTDPGCIDRFAAPIALVTKWYGGDPGAAGAHAYDDSKTPDAWAINGQTAPSDLYHQVFAHQCRSCHTQLNVATQQFNDYPTFESSFITKDSNASRVQETVFRKSQMPLARLTADRFWVDFSGGTSAAQVLANQIKSVNATDQVVDSAGNFIPPGAPLLRGTRVSQVDSSTPTSTVSPLSADTTTGIYTIKRNDAALVDISASPFASIYSATLCLKQTKDSTDSTPCVPQPVPLIGSTTALPAFNASNWGFYELQVTANNPLGTATPLTPILINAPQTLPNISGCVAQFANQSVANSTPTNPQVLTLDVSQCATLGDSPQLQLFDPSTGQWGPTSQATGTSGDYTASIAAFAIKFSFAESAMTPVTLNYRLCDVADSVCDASDNSSNTHAGTANAPVVINIASTYTALPRPYSISLTANTAGSTPLATVLTIPVSCTGATTPPAECANTAALTEGDTILPLGSDFNLVLGTPSAGSVAPLTQTTNVAQSGTIQYTAPTTGFVTCDINGKDINDPTHTQPCVPVSFTYDLQRASNTAEHSQSNVTVKINATTSFSQGGSPIYSMLAGCASGCHDLTPVDCSATPNDGRCRWTYDPASATNTLNALKAGACKNTAGTLSCISAGDPSNSLLYLNPCGSPPQNGHGAGSQTLPAPTATNCQVLSKWLAEGAHFN